MGCMWLHVGSMGGGAARVLEVSKWGKIIAQCTCGRLVGSRAGPGPVGGALAGPAIFCHVLISGTTFSVLALEGVYYYY